MATKNADFARSILQICFAPEVHHVASPGDFAFAHDRPMLQIRPNLRSCGGQITAANARRDKSRFWRHVTGPLSGSIMGLEGGPFVPVSADYGDE